MSLGSLHRYEEAVEEITECLNIYPNFEEGFLYNAQMLCKIKNYKLAVENIQEAIKINSKNQEAYLQLAICYKALKERGKERDLLKVLIEKYPKEGVFLMLLVECLLTLRENKDC